MEDVLEGLVGEIWDEHDEVIENIKELEDNVYLINCSTPMNDLADIYPFSDEVLDDNATVNGWVLDNLGKIPEVGDKFDFENLSVEVLKIDGRRASEIKLVVHPEDEEEDLSLIHIFCVGRTYVPSEYSLVVDTISVLSIHVPVFISASSFLISWQTFK